MVGLIPILTFILSMSSSACAFAEIPNFSSSKARTDSVLQWVQSNNQVVLARENKGQYVKFGVRIPSRPVNRRYSLAFTIEPARKDSVLRKGKVVVGTKTRAEVRITLERQVELVFPEGIRDLKVAYDKRLPPGKYLAEVSFKRKDQMLILHSHTFFIE
jgi:hypothetical protein